VTGAEFAAEVRSVLEFAPVNPGPIAPGLRGWWHKTDDGEVYLCARCAGRMLARSFNLPRGMEAVWTDKPEPFGVCVGCEPWTDDDDEPDAYEVWNATGSFPK
jgi:hypothetical protein